MFPEADAGYWTAALPCWALKNVTESHNHRCAVGGEVYDWEAGSSKWYSNHIWPLGESQDVGFFPLTEHYCNGTDKNTTHISILSTTGTDGVSLSKYLMEVVENFALETNIVGITSDGGR